MTAFFDKFARILNHAEEISTEAEPSRVHLELKNAAAEGVMGLVWPQALI